MKIGVYGDSFADTYSNKHSSHLAWYNQLPKLIPGSTVESFGLGATSLYFSYCKFLETYDQFDVVIFLVTENNRYTKKLYDIAGADRYFPNMLQVEYFLQSSNTKSKDKTTLEFLKGWFMMEDAEYNAAMAELMIEKMTGLHKNLIFFPCFWNSLSEQQSLKYGIQPNHTMCDFYFLQTRDLLKVDQDLNYLIENPELISCHFTEEFNTAIANAFTKKILTNVWDWSEVLNIKTLKHDKSQYYTTREK